MATATTSTASPRPTLAQLLAKFAGNYSGHGRALTMQLNGSGLISYRTYRWCSDDPTPPCDEMQGNNIIVGGQIEFKFTTAYQAGTETIAEGAFASSTDPAITPGQRLTGRRSGYILALSDGFTFCADDTPPKDWVCGA
jgi:hypothetical protein